ncbi:helix-turn-helix domain-containing protein [Paenibacillus thermoaerophilus]|uniref:Helix-turn-helix domain-containing protein n=1 Tax=Paenibacillus thermoaerophilus TaxID=1215385 RepID=A0ABW2UYD8_9BACL|nr:helix-turn-helix transcriptional regulator [Paenibacillus thermoaerophilus]TMV09432.1 helix-turn-helix transcriptional regulator [Paenibacillus thermoaerophilus]
MDRQPLGQRIRAYRKLKGLTQEQLADRMGISLSVLGSLERGTRPIDPRLLERIAEALNISAEELTAPSLG